MKEKLLVSACLLGENCKYSGGNNYTPAVEALKEKFDVISVCPEQMGGLPTPRIPAERVGEKVLTREGTDVTAEYRKGAEDALAIAKANGVKFAVLQERSPSCGSECVYDGTFSGKLIPGQGVTAQLLEEHGIKVYSSGRIEEFLKGEE